MTRSLVVRLGVACEQFGPGRLPRAENRTVGGGYTMATAAVLTALAFVLPALVLEVALGSGFQSLYVLFGPVALPLVAVGGFVSGVVTWRALPEGASYGVLGGVVATALTYVLATLLLVPLFYVVSYADWYSSVPGLLGSAAVFALVGTVLTAWLALPIGAVCGYLYERVRAEGSPA